MNAKLLAAIILVAVVVLLAVAGCNTPGGTSTPPAPTATPAPTPTPSPDWECDGLHPASWGWECWTIGPLGEREIQHIFSFFTSDGALELLPSGDNDYFGVSVRGDTPYYVTHCFQWGTTPDCYPTWQSQSGTP